MSVANRAAASSTAARSSPLPMGTITTWWGARPGGRTSPRSSPWAMITAPSIRVLKPHDVVWQWTSSFRSLA